MRFETSTLAALAAIASVTANIVEHDDGVANPSDATNHGNHGNRELTPAESPRAWAKITKTDVVKQDNGTSLIPTKIGNSELLSTELPSVSSASPLHPSETMLKNVPLTTPPHDDNAKSQDMDPIHFSDLGILAKNHVQKEEVEPTPEFLLEGEFQMFERDLEESSCESICGEFTGLPAPQTWDELYNTIHSYCSDTGSCSFNANKPINCWNVGEVTSMYAMFEGLKLFNERLNCWNVMKVTRMDRMFYGASAFNQRVNRWNVSKVTRMDSMFSGASAFNQPVNEWDVSQVSAMYDMFLGAPAFNQAVNEWDVLKVTSMRAMFFDASAFNQPVDRWNVSKVTRMSQMFYGASTFNQPVNEWDVSQVSNMDDMFNYATAFNQPVNKWDVSKVEHMFRTFYRASVFNQCLGTWPAKVPTGVTTGEMFDHTACPHGSGSLPSKSDKTWCQNENHQCTTKLPKPFSEYKIERAKNDDDQYAKVNDDNQVTIETFFKAKNDENMNLEIFHSVQDGTPCTKGTRLILGSEPTRTKIKDNAEDSTSTYKAQYVIDVKTLGGTPAYDLATGTIKICTTVAKMLESEYVSVVGTSFELTVSMEGTLSSDFLQKVTIEYDSEVGLQKKTITNSVSVDTFLCAPFRNADTKFKMGDEFGVCVRPNANAINDGYSVTKFESVVCSNGGTSSSPARTLITASGIQDDKLTRLLDDMSNTFDKDGNPAGKEAAGFVSLVTAGFFADKTKTSFECTGKVSLKREAQRKNRQRLLQEESNTSPFSTTIVLDTKNVASLSAAEASMVSCVGALLLSILVAIM